MASPALHLDTPDTGTAVAGVNASGLFTCAQCPSASLESLQIAYSFCHNQKLWGLGTVQNRCHCLTVCTVHDCQLAARNFPAHLPIWVGSSGAFLERGPDLSGKIKLTDVLGAGALPQKTSDPALLRSEN